MTERQAQTDILVGINGTGKTTLGKKIITHLLENGHRGLIVTPDPSEWQSVPLIHARHTHHIANYTGLRRIIYFKGCMELIQKYYKNGVLYFDDARVYIHAQSDDFMTWLQIRRRQAGIDFLAAFHGLTQVPPIFFTFATNMFLFYTKDNIKRRSEYIYEDDYDKIQQARIRIGEEIKKGNRHYFEHIKLDERF
jgi:glycosyltransferase involved in cell wall biosynthesis